MSAISNMYTKIRVYYCHLPCHNPAYKHYMHIFTISNYTIRAVGKANHTANVAFHWQYNETIQRSKVGCWYISKATRPPAVGTANVFPP